MPATEKNYAQLDEDQLDMSTEEAREIDLVELFFRLLEKSLWIVLAAFIGAAAIGAYTHFFVEPTYQSTAKLYVVSNSDSAINLTDLNLGDKVADDFVEVFKNRDVFDQVVIRMKADYGVDYPYSFSATQKMMSIAVIDNTRILKITVTSHSAEEAEQIATAYAKTAKEFITAVMGIDEPTDFEKARPGTLNKPGLVRNVIIGFMLGAVLAAGVVVIMFVVDDRVRTAEQLQKHLGLATLGMMPVQESESMATKKRVKGDRK